MERLILTLPIMSMVPQRTDRFVSGWKVVGGQSIAQSNPRVINFYVDGQTETEITVTANTIKNNENSFEEIFNTLTFGIFGKTDNSSATIEYRDNAVADYESGLAEQYYDIVGYDELQQEDDVEEYLKSYGWTTDAISVDVSENDVNSVTTGFDEAARSSSRKLWIRLEISSMQPPPEL